MGFNSAFKVLIWVLMEMVPIIILKMSIKQTSGLLYENRTGHTGYVFESVMIMMMMMMILFMLFCLIN